MLRLPLLVRNVSIAGWPSPAALLATIKTSYRLEGSSSVRRSSFSLPGTRTVCQLPTAPTPSSSCAGQGETAQHQQRIAHNPTQRSNPSSLSASKEPLPLAKKLLMVSCIYLRFVAKRFCHKSALLQLPSRGSFDKLHLFSRSIHTHALVFGKKTGHFYSWLKLARGQMVLKTSISL